MEQRLSWRRWVLVVTIGEFVGFLVPATVGILASDLSAGAQLVLLPLAGFFEGTALGSAQAVVLDRSWPAFRRRPWVLATGLAASAAWFLGMLPSTTHEVWSLWPTAWVVVAAAVLGTALLASIGIGQALVTPPGVGGRAAWVGWTMSGWCAGLTAFSAVAPPLWQPGQATWLLVLIGVAGGLAMALVMAAVTGWGAVRLVDRGRRADVHAGFTPGQHLFSRVLGEAVYDASGRKLGRVLDLAGDLAVDSDRPPLMHVLVGPSRRRGLVVPYLALSPRQGGGLCLDPALAATSVLGSTTLWLGRDVLDAPVVLAAPPRRTRVSDVLLDVKVGGACVVGLDISPAGMARRITHHRSTGVVSSPVAMSRVHLGSPHGHAAQLAAPDPAVLALPAEGMAEVLTRVPVAHAREIIGSVEAPRGEDAVQRLHPHVRARVTGTGPPTRRMRRLSGWRLHRPGPLPPRGEGR